VVKQKLTQINHLIYSGKPREALIKLTKLEELDELSQEDNLTFLHLKIQILINLGQYQEARSLAEQLKLVSQQLEHPLSEFDALNTNIEALCSNGQFKKANEFIQQTEGRIKEIFQTQVDQLRKARYLFWKAYAKAFSLEIKKSIEIVKESLNLRETFGNPREIAQSLQLLGFLYQNTGEIEKALTLLQKSHEIQIPIGNQQDLGYTFEYLGLVYQAKDRGQAQVVLDYFQKSLNAHKSIGNPKEIANILWQIGRFHWFNGDYMIALELFKQTLKDSKKINYNTGIANTLNGLGIIYFYQGELQLALEHFNEALPLFEEVGNPVRKAAVLGNIGETYDNMGNFEEAFDSLQQALNISRNSGFDLYHSEHLYQIIRRCNKHLSEEPVKAYLEELKHICNRDNHPIIYQQYRLSQAIVLASSDRLQEQFEAQGIFQEVADSQIAKFELTVVAMLQLGQLLTLELEMTGNELVMTEVKQLLDRLTEIAKNQNSHWLLVEAYLILSKLALIEFNIKRSQDLLIQAELLAKEKGLNKLSQILVLEKDLMEDQLNNLEYMLTEKRSLTIKEKIQITCLEDLFKRMINKSQYHQVDELEKYAKKARKMIELLDRDK
jgi:tetratricopeptide (TPR) repeat protein